MASSSIGSVQSCLWRFGGSSRARTRMAMTKADIVDRIYEKVGFSKKRIRRRGRGDLRNHQGAPRGRREGEDLWIRELRRLTRSVPAREGTPRRAARSSSPAAAFYLSRRAKSSRRRSTPRASPEGSQMCRVGDGTVQVDRPAVNRGNGIGTGEHPHELLSEKDGIPPSYEQSDYPETER